MRIFLPMLLLSLVCFMAKSETIELANFQDGFGKEQSIKLALDDDKPLAVIIPCQKEDDTYGFIVQPINYVFAIESYLNEIKEKYKEWTQTAISNGIEEYEKNFMASGYQYGFIWFNPEKRQGLSGLNAVWKYDKDKDINQIELHAKVVDTLGSCEITTFKLLFLSIEDIECILDAISQSNIKAHTPVTVDSLFK